MGSRLSARLLLLTILFVMVAEILVFVPSVANFRQNWLMEKLAAARIAVLAAEVRPDHQLPKTVHDALLKSVMVHSLAVKRAHRRTLILQSDMPPVVAEHFDLRKTSWRALIMDALAVFTAPDGRFISVIGEPELAADQFIEIVVSESPLKAAMVGFGLNILGLSILISVITAALVYFALNAMLVRPISQLTQNMVRFSRGSGERSQYRGSLGTAR